MTQLNYHSFQPSDINALTLEQQAELQRRKDAEDPTFGETAWAAWQSIGLTRTLARKVSEAIYRPPPDHDFVLTPDIALEFNKGLPEDWVDEFAVARSYAHAEQIREGLLDLQADRETLSRAGGMGTALSIGASLTDPTELLLTIAVTMGTAGLGTPIVAGASMTSMLSRAARGGLIAATTDIGIMAFDNTLDPDDYTGAEFLGATILSFGLGSAIDYRMVRKMERRASGITPYVFDFGDEIDDFAGLETRAKDIEVESAEIIIELGNLEREIEALNTEIAGATKGQSDRIDAQIGELGQKEAKIARLKEQADRVASDVDDRTLAVLETELIEARNAARSADNSIVDADSEAIYQTLLSEWTRIGKDARVRGDATNIDIIAENILRWENEHRMPSPMATTPDGSLIYWKKSDAEAAGKRLQKNVDRDHVQESFQNQNLPRNVRAQKPKVEVKSPSTRADGKGGYVVQIVDETAGRSRIRSAEPYVADTAGRRRELVQRQAVLEEQVKDLQYDLLRRELGRDASFNGDVASNLSTRGKGYFQNQLARELVDEDAIIDRHLQDATPDEVRPTPATDSRPIEIPTAEEFAKRQADEAADVELRNTRQDAIDDAIANGTDYYDELIDEDLVIDGEITNEGIAAIGAASAADIDAIRQAAIDAAGPDGRHMNDFFLPETVTGGPELVGKPRFAKVRIGMAAWIGDSDSDIVRRLGRSLVEDVIPDTLDNPTSLSASEWSHVEYARSMHDVVKTNHDSYKAWAKSQNRRHWWNTDVEEEFQAAVTKVHRSGTPSGDVNIDRAAIASRKKYAEDLEMLKRHGVPGFEDLPENPYYVPRLHVKPQLDALVAEIGEENVIRLIEEAWFKGRMVDEPKFVKARRKARKSIRKIEKTINRKKDTERIRTSGKKTGDELDAQLAKRKLVDDKNVAKLGRAKKRLADAEKGLAASKQVEMDPALKHKLARGYYEKISRVGEMTDVELDVIFNTQSRSALRAVIGKIADVSKDEMEQILDAFHKTAGKDAGYVPRARRRANINENYILKKEDSGLLRDVEFSELLENNSRRLQERYARQALGAAAMQTIFRGFGVTGDSMLTRTRTVLRMAEDEMITEGISPMKIQSTLHRLDVAMRSVQSIPLQENQHFAAAARSLRDYQTARLGGRFGLAQFADLGPMVASTGLGNIMAAIPTLRSLTKGIANGGRFDTQLARELQGYWAFGNELMMNNLSARFDFGGDATRHTTGKLSRGAARLSDLTMRASGLSWIDSRSRRLAAIGMLEKWKGYASADRIPSKKRLLFAGLSEADAKKINEQIRKHGGEAHKGMLGVKQNGLGLEHWDSLELQSKFINSISKSARRMVQQQDIGQMSAWMTQWWGRSIIQFRGFSIGAWEKHTLANLYLRDWTSAMDLSWGLHFGAMSYLGVIASNALGRPAEERQEYLDKNLRWEALVRGAWMRSNTSSLLPSFIDTVLWSVGEEEWFSQGRPSGMTSRVNAFAANPTTDMLGGVMLTPRLLRAPVDPTMDVTRSDFRAGRQLVALQNLYGAQQLLDMLQYSRPSTQPE